MYQNYGPIMITGAGSGIGKATTHFLADRGFHVYATDVNEQLLNKFEYNKRINTIKMDVTKKNDIKNALSIVIENNNGLFGLVNGAGVIRLGPIIEAPEEELEMQLNVNVLGMYRVTKECFPLLKESKGRIINISSAAGRFVSPFYGFYSMSKMAVEAFSDALRRELRPFGIRVAVIQPGLVRTPLWDKLYSDPSKYGNSIFKTRLEKFVNLSVYDAMPKAISPERFARAIFHALTNRIPKSHYFISHMKFSQIMAEKLPIRVIDYIISRI